MWFQKIFLTPNFITLLLFSWTFIMKPYNNGISTKPFSCPVLFCLHAFALAFSFTWLSTGSDFAPTYLIFVDDQQTVLVVTAGGCCWHPVGRGMLVNILQYTGQSSRHRITQSKTVLRLKDPGLDKSFALRCVHMLTILDDVF